MRERPIIFSGEMVRAILEGRKTQTRRVIKIQPIEHQTLEVKRFYCLQARLHYTIGELIKYLPQYCIYGKSGDRLWVREAWALAREYDKKSGSKIPKDGHGRIWYLADGSKPEWAGRTRSGRFMPRWASRITLEITCIRVERVQEISQEEAQREGVKADPPTTWIYFADYRSKFEELWNSINGKRGYGWNDNPWVWVVEFMPYNSSRRL